VGGLGTWRFTLNRKLCPTIAGWHLEFLDGIAKADSLSKSNEIIAVERPELVFALQGKMYPELQCHMVWGEIPSIEFKQLLSAVRTRVLDFSLRVQAENPDAGEAAPNAEQVPPERLRPTLQTTIFGNVGAIAQNSDHFTQQVTVAVSPQEIAKFVREFSSHIDELGLEERQMIRAEAQLVTLKAESVGDPDPVIVRQAGRTLRTITEGAIGSLLATAMQPSVWKWIHEMLEKLSK
jgi:AbiTii